MRKFINLVFYIFFMFVSMPSFAQESIYSFQQLKDAIYNGGNMALMNDIYYEGLEPVSVSSEIALNGGGYALNGSDIGINIVFRENTAKYISELSVLRSSAVFGGAFRNEALSSLSVANSTFTHNVSFGNITASGGAVYNSGIIDISNSYFGHNSSADYFYTDYLSGGAFENIMGTAAITSSMFEGNYSANIGGAIGNAGSLSISGSEFTDNYANVSGGAIYNDYEGKIYFYGNNYFSGNEAAEGKDIFNNGSIFFSSGTNILHGGIEGAGQTIIESGELIMPGSVFVQNELVINDGSFYVSADSFSVSGTAFNDGLITFSTGTFASLSANFEGSGKIKISTGSIAEGYSVSQGNLEIIGENIRFENKGILSAALALERGSSFAYDSENMTDISGGELNLSGISSSSGSIAQNLITVAADSVFNNYGDAFASVFINTGTVSGGNISVSSMFVNSGEIYGSTIAINQGSFFRAESGSSINAYVENAGTSLIMAGEMPISLAGDIHSDENGTIYVSGTNAPENIPVSERIASLYGSFTNQAVIVSSAALRINSGGRFNNSSLELAEGGTLLLRDGEVSVFNLSGLDISGNAYIDFDASFVSGSAESDKLSVSGMAGGNGILNLGSVNIISDDWMEVSSLTSFRLIEAGGGLDGLNIAEASAAASFGEYQLSQDQSDHGIINVIKTGTGKTLAEAFSSEAIDSYSMSSDVALGETLSLAGEERNLTVHGNSYSIDGSSFSAISVGLKQSLSFKEIGEIRNFNTYSEEGAAGFLINEGNAYISSATIRNNNNALYGGGAIYNTDSGILFLEEVSFSDNYSNSALSDIYNNGQMYVSSVSFSGGVQGSGSIEFMAGDSLLSDEGIISQNAISIGLDASLTAGAGNIAALSIMNDGILNLSNGNGMIEGDRILVSSITGTGTLNVLDTIESNASISQGTIVIPEHKTLTANAEISAFINNNGALVYRSGLLPDDTSIIGSGMLRISGETENKSYIEQGSLSINDNASLESDASILNISGGIVNNGSLSFTGGINVNAISGTYGILKTSGTLINHNAISQARMENSGVFISTAELSFDEAINKGVIAISSSVFTISPVYENTFSLPFGSSLILNGDSIFNKTTGSIAVSEGMLMLEDSSRINAASISIGGGTAVFSGNSNISSSGQVSISGGNVYLSGNSYISAVNGLAISGGTLYSSDSPRISSLGITGGKIKMSSALTVDGNVQIHGGSTIESDIFSAEEYGKLEAPSVEISGSGTVLSAVVHNDFLARGESVSLDIIKSDSALNGSFARLRASTGYELSAIGDGTYNLTYLASVDKYVRQAGGNDNNVRAGDAWFFYSPEEGSAGAASKAKLDDAYLDSPADYVNMLTAMAPESSPANAAVAGEINRSIYGSLSSRLASLEGMASGDVFSNSGVWGNMLYSRNEFTRGLGYDADTFGAAIGADSEFFDGLARAGIGYSYASTALDSMFRDTDIKTNTFFLYGQYVSEYFSYRGMISYGKSSYVETVNAGLVSGINEYDSGTIGISAIAEYCPEYMDLGNYEWVKSFSPLAGFRFSSFDRGAYHDSFGQETGSYSYSLLTAILGLSWKENYYVSGNVFRPEFNAGFSFDINEPSNSVNVSLPGGPSYDIYMDKLPRASFELGGTAAVITENGSEIGLSYTGSFRSSHSSHAIMLSGKMRF